MSSIFTKIVNDELPCYKITENENFLAFLDINPLEKGHSLVIPKVEVDYIFNLDNELYKELFLFAKNIAYAIEKTVACKRIGMAVIGLEVPHAHIHLVPISGLYDIDFQKPKKHFSAEEFKEIAENISSNLLLQP